jgi:ribonuclease BN (tRNA processing enzyme)
MEAEHIVLFHFSQRYPRLPPEVGQSDSPWSNVALSFDLMSYTRGELRLLSQMLPAVRMVFEKQQAEEAELAEVDEAE